MKTKLPNGELKRMEDTIREMKDNYADMKDDISDIKFTLLNPEDGIVVRVNKNTSWRHEREERTAYYDRLANDFEKMKDWKDAVTKALWIVFTALVGIVGYILSGVMPQ